MQNSIEMIVSAEPSKANLELAKIVKSAVLSWVYACDVVKGPFPAGEPIIARSAEYSYLYALFILKKPFPAGEPIIARSAEYSYLYALDVLKDPNPSTWRKRFLKPKGDYHPWKAIQEV